MTVGSFNIIKLGDIINNRVYLNEDGAQDKLKKNMQNEYSKCSTMCSCIHTKAAYIKILSISATHLSNFTLNHSNCTSVYPSIFPMQ